MNDQMRSLAEQMRGGAIGSMNLQPNTVQPAMANPVGDGIGGSSVQLRTLQREALAKSYVAGYIMASAPAISLSMQKGKSKNGESVFSIQAKESKPSRCLRVLLRVPRRCVNKAGNIAQPAEILSGMVDFNTISPDEFDCYAMEQETAVGYILALGGYLPEYAPHVSDERDPWSVEAVLSGNANVSYVWAKPQENKRRKDNRVSKFGFALKTTSPRRSLYTPKNHACLRAVEHMDVKCTTEEEAYRLNESAFGAWRYRKPKTQTMDNLTKAFSECPSQIWEKKYTIDGEEKDSIGSVYFMVGTEEINSHNEKVMRRQLTYYPWYQTGNLRPEAGTRVNRIVRRTLSIGEGEKKTRMVTHPVYYKDDPNNVMFKGYASFIDFAINNGYLTADALRTMGGRTSKKSKQLADYTPDQMDSLKSYLRSTAVQRGVDLVQNEYADRKIMQSV